MVILFTVATIKNRRRGESMSGFIWRSTAKVCVKIRPIRRFRELCQGLFRPFWEGALGPFALGNFRYFNRNWENFFNQFYIIFLNRDPKTALKYSYSWLYALF